MNRQQRRQARAQQKRLPVAKVCVGIPSGAQWPTRFGMDLLQLVLVTTNRSVPGVYNQVHVVVKCVTGSMLWKQRSDIMRAALEQGCTHLFFIDTDQTFPASTILRLLYHQVPVVAANVCVKEVPTKPTARQRHNGEAILCFTRPESHGLEEVWRIGTGVMLVDLGIVPKLSQPWFKVSAGDEEENYGEDWWFCAKVEEAGLPIYIDHDLSKEVGHLGQMEYQHFMVPRELVEIQDQLLQEAQDGIEKETKKRFRDLVDARVAAGSE